jgi:hypothetical protein
MAAGRRRSSAWCAAVLAPIAAFAAWVLLDRPGPERVRLPRGIDLATWELVGGACSALAVALAIAAWWRVPGLLLTAGVLLGVATVWPLITDNAASGPVVLELEGGHGVHENDWLALVPAVVAIGVLVEARAASRDRHPPR